MHSLIFTKTSIYYTVLKCNAMDNLRELVDSIVCHFHLINKYTILILVKYELGLTYRRCRFKNEFWFFIQESKKNCGF